MNGIKITLTYESMVHTIVENVATIVLTGGEGPIAKSMLSTFDAIIDCIPELITMVHSIGGLSGRNFTNVSRDDLIMEAIDFPLASAAVTLVLESGNGKIKDIKAVINAVGSGPIELEGIPSLLKGNTLNDELIERASQEAVKQAHPVANTISTPDYRKKMAGVMFKRALKAAYEEAKK